MNKREATISSQGGCATRKRSSTAFLELPALLAMLIMGLGCSIVPGVEEPGWLAQGERPVWPEPPAAARIEYVGSIRSGADLGRGPSWGSRFLSIFFGERPSSMIRPAAVAKNRSGILVVADPGVPTLHFFDLERRRYERLADDEEGRLVSPVGVAIADDGYAYVADSVRARIFVIKNEKIIGEIGADELARPSGVALNPDQDRLYVADTLANQIVVFDLAGVEQARFGRRGVEPGEFNAPTYLAISASGEIAISDSLNFRVQIFDPEGGLQSHFGGPGDGAGDFTRPKGIGVDSRGRIYVVDTAFDNIQVFDPSGQILLAFGRAGSAKGEFSLPVGLFVDASDMIWVADGFNQRVQVFQIISEAP